MATKKYNIQYFTLQENNSNNQVVFYCYTTKTRCGFCHTVVTINNSTFGPKMISDTKSSYYNRTWERYEYESTLKKACNKLGKSFYNSAFINNNIRRTF